MGRAFLEAGIRQEEVIHQAGVAVGRSVLKWIQRVGLEEFWFWLGGAQRG